MTRTLIGLLCLSTIGCTPLSEQTLTYDRVGGGAAVAIDDQLQTYDDEALTITLSSDLFSNDNGYLRSPVALAGVDSTSSEGGSIVNHGDGTLTYSPPASFTGTDTFLYEIENGSDPASSATVSLAVLLKLQLAHNFSSGNFTGSTGADPWSGNWLELGEADGAGAGDIRAGAYAHCDNIHCLRFAGAAVPSGAGVSREADLTGTSQATLSFQYRRVASLSAVEVECSANGGVSFGPVATISAGTDGGQQSFQEDVSSCISGQTVIRMVAQGGSLGIWIDTVDLTATQ